MSPSRLNVPAGTPWEETLGYSRAVRVGDVVAVGQTSAVAPDGTIAGGRDPYQQAVFALRNVEAALAAAGARIADVIRTRIYLADLAHWPEAARAHAETFAGVKPACSIVRCEMVSPDILVEFEVDAIVGAGAEPEGGRLSGGGSAGGPPTFLALDLHRLPRPAGKWREILRVPSMSVGVYELKAGDVDEQRPHTEDEVYYVVSGRSKFRAGDEECHVGPGSLLYVGRSLEHRFFDIREDLTVLVLFAPAEGSLDLPAFVQPEATMGQPRDQRAGRGGADASARSTERRR